MTNFNKYEDSEYLTTVQGRLFKAFFVVAPSVLECCIAHFLLHISPKVSFKMFVCRELIRCLKWYMDRSAEVVRQDHIQDAMRVSSMLENV